MLKKIPTYWSNIPQCQWIPLCLHNIRLSQEVGLLLYPKLTIININTLTAYHKECGIVEFSLFWTLYISWNNTMVNMLLHLEFLPSVKYLRQTIDNEYSHYKHCRCIQCAFQCMKFLYLFFKQTDILSRKKYCLDTTT